MLKIVALVVLLLVVVGVVFIVVRSIVVKLLSMTLVIFALVLVIALNGDNIKSKTSPITLDNNEVFLYIDGEEINFKTREVQRVDISNSESGGVLIRIVHGSGQHSIPISTFSYEWRLKNSLNKAFQGRIYDSTF